MADLLVPDRRLVVVDGGGAHASASQRREVALRQIIGNHEAAIRAQSDQIAFLQAQIVVLLEKAPEQTLTLSGDALRRVLADGARWQVSQSPLGDITYRLTPPEIAGAPAPAEPVPGKIAP